MRRATVIAVVLPVVIAACGGDATEPITRPSQAGVTTAPTTTTTSVATPTTTPAPMEILGVEGELALERRTRNERVDARQEVRVGHLAHDDRLASPPRKRSRSST